MKNIFVILHKLENFLNLFRPFLSELWSIQCLLVQMIFCMLWLGLHLSDDCFTKQKKDMTECTPCLVCMFHKHFVIVVIYVLLICF